MDLNLSCANDCQNLISMVTGCIYKLKRIVGSNNFSVQFIKIISHYKKIGYNINVLQQTACLVVNPITVGNFAFLFNCMPVSQGPSGQKIGPVRFVCRFMVTYIKTFNGVLPLI